LALIFIAGINIWSPSLSIIRENKILLLLFVAFTAIAPLTALQRRGIFVGFRKTEYSFYQTFVTSARIGIVPFLVTSGAIGIYVSYGLTSALAFALGIFLTSNIFPYKLIPEVKREVVSDILHFSSGNYFARIFEILPNFVLPIMVINILGAEKNAYFFIAWQISMLVHAIPEFSSMSLLAEGSYNQEEIVWNAKRAMKFILILLVVIIVGIFLFGKYLLWIFGEEYAKNSLNVLLILVFGSIPFAFNAVYASIKRVKKEIKPVIWIYGGIAVITLSVAYLLVRVYSIEGIGVGWLIGNTAVTVGIGIRELSSNRFRLHC